MKLRRYTLLSFLFIAIIGGYVEVAIDAGFYTLDILGFVYKLPVSVWVVVPLILLYFASLFHMIFHNLKNYLYNKTITTDYNNMIDFLKAKALDQTPSQTFKTQEFKNLSTILKESSISLLDIHTTGVTTIDSLVTDLNKVRNNEVINLKPYSLAHDNPVYLKNAENRIEQESNYALDVLKKSTNYDVQTLQKAYMTLIKNHDEANIKKYMNIVHLDLEIIQMLIAELKETIDLTTEDLENIFANSKLTAIEYMKIARVLKLKINPDEVLELTNRLFNDNEDMIEAVIFVYLDFEMVDKAQDILDAYDEDEFTQFRTYLLIKEHGINLSISKYLNLK
jgi:hypothetical protein